MNNTIVNKPRFLKSQYPLDIKIISPNTTTLMDLGDNNEFAYSYYNGMEVFVMSNNTKYRWLEWDSNGNIPGLLENGFTYPDCTFNDLYDYSNKTFNFIPEDSDLPKTFLSLLDTPNDYQAKSLFFVRVKQDETGLEFIKPKDILWAKIPQDFDSVTDAINQGYNHFYFTESYILDNYPTFENYLPTISYFKGNNLRIVTDYDFDDRILNFKDINFNHSANHIFSFKGILNNVVSDNTITFYINKKINSLEENSKIINSHIDKLICKYPNLNIENSIIDSIFYNTNLKIDYIYNSIITIDLINQNINNDIVLNNLYNNTINFKVFDNNIIFKNFKDNIVYNNYGTINLKKISTENSILSNNEFKNLDLNISTTTNDKLFIGNNFANNVTINTNNYTDNIELGFNNFISLNIENNNSIIRYSNIENITITNLLNGWSGEINIKRIGNICYIDGYLDGINATNSIIYNFINIYFPETVYFIVRKGPPGSNFKQILYDKILTIYSNSLDFENYDQATYFINTTVII